ncbi:hypothetical protein RIR_jg22746.t1 [Rhizophagus irregularis DAOM 181602=DAOM 197198]|uniref:Uncharacterized protein n=1 Tax=Rhizophagus irregularis (strain DAOM 197198w) TaxID=1432141 RepID=A0A015KDY8_RHIIW|nr:hypothetical protein RirG_131450 [Rhizophagus irregularis DAOM 197198w]GBC34004.1 hypothetical protein RIR_jg22746.t1 [Rhizophagus irregularis DAOM 181602=DAOM 197198]
MDENIKEINLSNRIVGLLEELPKIRHEAKEQILKSQTKQKEYHDRKIIKEHTFGIGDKILLYDKAKAQQLSGVVGLVVCLATLTPPQPRGLAVPTSPLRGAGLPKIRYYPLLHLLLKIY